ncbi:MAG: tRNA (N(6)-L-threonylcarbamoyladenosine(37)-C(2))-methylthiotransferase MtaB [Pseudomonadota bacterium]
MSGPELITFGCRLNSYESEVIRETLRGAADDILVFNTCAVTTEAVRQARQAIRKARRARPGAHIVVTGCAAQIDPDAFSAMAEVDRVLGNGEKFARRAYDFSTPYEKVLVNDIMAVRETAGHMISAFAERARAFIAVQNGCDHRCTFCIIPYGRGPARSLPAGAVIDQVKRLVDAGYREVVLTGVDLTSYGADLPSRPSLGHLVQRILRLVPDLARLRLSSIDSIEADEALIEALAGDARVMPHVHLSLQAGDDMILKRMKRRHTRADAIAFVERLRAARPEMTFGADLIAGFPTEDEAMFENSLRLVDDCDLVFLHVFPFSARKGTPAARMPQLPPSLRKERAARLREKGAQRLAGFLRSKVGAGVRVLVERIDEKGVAHGHGEQFFPVRLTPAPGLAESVVGTVVNAHITHVGADHAWAVSR